MEKSKNKTKKKRLTITDIVIIYQIQVKMRTQKNMVPRKFNTFNINVATKHTQKIEKYAEIQLYLVALFLSPSHAKRFIFQLQNINSAVIVENFDKKI